MDDQFYKYPKLLMMANAFVSRVDGSLVKMSESDKSIYVVMKARNEFFKDHYDTQESIAAMCGVTERKVRDSLRMFIDHGVIDAVFDKTDSSGREREWRKNYKYKKVHCLSLVRVGPKERGKPPKEERLGELSEDLWEGVQKKAEKKGKVDNYDPEPDYSSYYYETEERDPF